jgi:hypothetical protein
MSIESALRELRAAGYQIKEPLPKPEPNRCFVCGITDDYDAPDDDIADLLVPIQVIVSEGEEGQANELRYFCYFHFTLVTEPLIKLGFGSHRHGGINFLEDESCGGYYECDVDQDAAADEDWPHVVQGKQPE